jgi:ADP-ribose pyrophosphatase
MRIVYKGSYLSINSGRIKKGNKEIAYEELLDPDAVSILPFLKKDTIILERNFRPVLGKYHYEIPSGHLNKDEKPIDAARRELMEETGYGAKSMKLLFVAYGSPGISKAKLYHFLAEGLTKGRRDLDADEIIEVEKIKLSRALEMIDKGIIEDEETIAFLEYFARKYK